METNKNEVSAEENLKMDINNMFAKHHSTAISAYVRRSFEQKRKNGELTGRAPFGYINTVMTEADYKRATIAIDAEKSQLVKRMFELCAKNIDPIGAIKAQMPEMRADNPQGALLSRSQIVRILTNPFYCGIIVSQNYGNYEHKYDCIVSRELFDKCQKALMFSCPMLPCISVSSILTEVNEKNQDEK